MKEDWSSHFCGSGSKLNVFVTNIVWITSAYHCSLATCGSLTVMSTGRAIVNSRCIWVPILD